MCHSSDCCDVKCHSSDVKRHSSDVNCHSSTENPLLSRHKRDTSSSCDVRRHSSDVNCHNSDVKRHSSDVRRHSMTTTTPTDADVTSYSCADGGWLPSVHHGSGLVLPDCAAAAAATAAGRWMSAADTCCYLYDSHAVNVVDKLTRSADAPSLLDASPSTLLQPPAAQVCRQALQRLLTCDFHLHVT